MQKLDILKNFKYKNAKIENVHKSNKQVQPRSTRIMKFIQEAKLQQHIHNAHSDNNVSRKIPYTKLNELSATHQHNM